MVEFEIVDMKVVYKSPGHLVNEKYWDIVPKPGKMRLGSLEWDFDPRMEQVASPGMGQKDLSELLLDQGNKEGVYVQSKSAGSSVLGPVLETD